MKNIDQIVDKDVPFDKDFANEHDLSVVSECALTSSTEFVSSEDIELHAKLRYDIVTPTPAKDGSAGAARIDMFQEVALMEMLHPVKFDIL